MNRLPLRLLEVARLVDKGSVLADIGSDHALLPIYLIENGICPFCQAIENKKGPYLGMLSSIKEAGLEEQVKASYGDGLSVLSEEITSIALCGMGGLLIDRILRKNPDKLAQVDYIVVDPHKNEELVRKTLSELGFSIVDETIIEEKGIFYSLIKAKRKANPKVLSEDDLLFGPIARKKRNEAFIRKWRKKENQLESILQEDLSKKKKEEVLSLLARIKKELS